MQPSLPRGKEIERGTDLTLSQVYGFVRQSGGNVEVVSTVGAGTTFTVFLPRAEGEIAVERPSLSDNGGAPKALRVLVVDYDERVGQFTTETLQDLGHDTVLAHSGSEALRLLAADDLSFDVVFSDVMMTGMTGLELAQTLRERHPGLPVLLTRGYSEVISKEGTHGFCASEEALLG